MVSVRAANVLPKAMAKRAKPAKPVKVAGKQKDQVEIKAAIAQWQQENTAYATPCLAAPFPLIEHCQMRLKSLLIFLTIFLNVHLTVHSTQARSAFCSWLMLDWHWRLPSSVFRAIFRIAASNSPILLSYVWYVCAQAHKHATPPHLYVYV